MMKSPRSIVHLMPSTVVNAPSPSTMRRSAAGVWWWLGAVSPGRLTWSPAKSVEVEVYKNDGGEWVAEAIEYKVTATGRTESEALARVMDALAAHFKQTSKR